jgi:phenylacetate-CoA ligase
VVSTRFDSIYRHLPITLQNVACSGYGWVAARKRYNARFRERLAWLKESDFWSLEQIKAYQDKCVRETVAYAYSNVPFYREWFGDHGIKPQCIAGVEDLPRLPVLSKEIVRTHQKQMVTQALDKSSLIMEATSGTTGTPLAIPFTEEGLALQWAVWWRHKFRFGLKPHDSHVSFSGKSFVPIAQARPPYWRHDWVGNRTLMSVYHINRETVGDIVAYLNSHPHKFFTGAASGIYALTIAMEEAALTLARPPTVIVCGADVLLPKHVKSFQRCLGAPVTEQYGMTEFAGNMSKCEMGRFHVDFECGVVEHLPIEGVDYSRLILTGWGNLAMPFIRYEVGDFGVPLTGRCECGRESACFGSVDGRLEDYIVRADGCRMMGMNQVLNASPNVKEVQIFQAADGAVEFRIIPEKSFMVRDREMLEQEFRKRAGTALPVSFSFWKHLPRGANGKLRAVISELHEGTK